MNSIKVPVIQFSQNNNCLYTFVINGKKLPLFASISRIKRDEDQYELTGYQRPQVVSHIGEIRRYLESENPMIPNSIVIAFDERVKFTPVAVIGKNKDGFGYLEIPTDTDIDDIKKPGWVVDGQQRMTAIQEANIESFPISVVAFIATDEGVQREHFVRVNSAKPLPKDLIDELIPETTAFLDTGKERRKCALDLRNHLNYTKGSKLYKKIKTPTSPTGIITSGSIVKMLENSLSNGVLFRYRYDGADGKQTILKIVRNFWDAVAITFPEAWELPPSKSRLTHGAGIISLGLIMDAICDEVEDTRVLEQSDFVAELVKLRPHCKWTHGEWNFGSGITRRWNDIQNIPRDIELLANHLVKLYTDG